MDKKAKKRNWKKRNSLRQAFCGNKVAKKPLKMQENNHFWAILYQAQAQKHREKKQNHQNQKNDKNLLHSGKPPPIFVKCLFFIKLHSLMSAKLCFAENTIKIVFSAEHSF